MKNDVEYILFLRKGGDYRSPSPIQRALSMLTKEEMQSWMRSSWTDIKGESTRKGHPAPYPIALADRLITMFSFAGDTVLDPFAGTGTTAIAALNAGRNSICVEIETKYVGQLALAHASGDLYIGRPGASVAQLDRASDYGSEGSRFNSWRMRQVLNCQTH